MFVTLNVVKNNLKNLITFICKKKILFLFVKKLGFI